MKAEKNSRNKNKLWANAFSMRYHNTRIEGIKNENGIYNIWFIKVWPRLADDHPGKGYKGFKKVVFRNKLVYTIFEIALSMDAIQVMFSGISQLEQHINDLQCHKTQTHKVED